MAKLGIVHPIKKLQQLSLAEETELIGFGVYNEIKSLVEFLMDLQKKITTASDGVKEIEDLVYRIEDVLQSYGVLARSTSYGMMSPFKYFYHRERKQANRSITSSCKKIHQFAKKLVESRCDVQGYSFEESHSWNDDNQQRQNSTSVGLEEETELIVQVLLKDTTLLDFLAVAIWGRSGTGKDILARKVCGHSRILETFKSIPIRVSENIDVHNTLVYVLEQFTAGSVDMYKKETDETLKDNVRKHLKASRTLIFLEGVRSVDDWQRLYSVLGVEGCRILFTTRAREVAEGITQAMYIHEKRPLTEKHRWELLEKILLQEMDPGANIEPAKERMGRDMVKFSEGIPGAIITLAKQLAGKSATEWEMVQKNARQYLSQVMAPSYADLSDDQKLYFLYLGHFREDPEIEPEKLSHLWAIEGLISSQDSVSGMAFLDVTQEILMVLAQKQMIDVEKIIEVKSCRLVGLMGDMCLSKAEETAFLKVMDLQITNQPSFSCSKTHRLVIYLGKYDTRITTELAPNLRSLRIIRPVHDHQHHEQLDQEVVWPSIMSNIKNFKALRILDFGRVDFRRGKFSRGIFDLPFLRYLSFEGCFLEKLPSSISNLSYLEVLDLRIKDNCEIIIPDVLRRMGRLQHLYLPRAFQMQNGGKLRLDGLAELQTLRNFNSKLCEIGDLFKLTKLRNLDAKVEESLEDLKSITERMKTGGQKWLHSSIEVKNFDCYTEKKHSVFRQLLAFGVPPILSFEGHIDPLPPYNNISQSFTEIVFHSTQLKEDPMAILENLAQLRLLVLDDDAFLGEKMVCSAFGFPELKHLQLSSLLVFNKWTVENKAMPRLSHLKIYNCKKLETLPDGSEFLDSLHEFKTGKMPKPLVDMIQARYLKLKHPPSLILDNGL
ncbi:unnamed protein product [Withania somnifera]